MKNPEMLKFFLIILKLKKTYKHANKKLPYLLRYVSDQYKTQKNCDKAVDTHLLTIAYAPECYKTQEMCNKAVHRSFFCI